MNVKTVKLSSKRQITIPTSFDSFKTGGKAIMIQKKNGIFIRPIQEGEEMLLMSSEALAENWLSKEDEEAFAYLQ